MQMSRSWEWFVTQFEQISKIDLNYYKRPQMERRISSFMRSLDIGDYEAFVQVLKKDQGVLEKFVLHITINVSEFFRNSNHWDKLAMDVIPELLKQRSRIKIWSAGCSTGEEAYSLAILALENKLPLEGNILATDIDRGVLEKAEIGLYSRKALENVPAKYLKKYFTEQGEFYRINSEIKNMVNFKRQDLLRDRFEQGFDLILCRNVVIYFTEESKSLLYRKFAEAMRSKGVLFIGSTEQIFQARELGLSSMAIFFYQKS